jgi:hypothetical protein
MRRLMVLDFDRTLFDNKFYDAWCAALIKSGLLDKKDADDALRMHNDSATSLDMLVALQGVGVDIPAAMRVMHEVLDPNDFIYKDVASFLIKHKKDQVLIVTTGNEDWQSIKLDYSPILYHYPHIIIQGNKGCYLADALVLSDHTVGLPEVFGEEQFAGMWLYDDRVDSLAPLSRVSPELIQLVHVQRDDAKYPCDNNHPGIRHITSLKEAL